MYQKGIMELKTEIEKHLERTGKRIYHLADEAGVPRTSVYRFLNGERDLLLETAKKIEAAIRKKRKRKK